MDERIDLLTAEMRRACSLVGVALAVNEAAAGADAASVAITPHASHPGRVVVMTRPFPIEGGLRRLHHPDVGADGPLPRETTRWCAEWARETATTASANAAHLARGLAPDDPPPFLVAPSLLIELHSRPSVRNAVVRGVAGTTWTGSSHGHQGSMTANEGATFTPIRQIGRVFLGSACLIDAGRVTLDVEDVPGTPTRLRAILPGAHPSSVVAASAGRDLADLLEIPRGLATIIDASSRATAGGSTELDLRLRLERTFITTTMNASEGEDR